MQQQLGVPADPAYARHRDDAVLWDVLNPAGYANRTGKYKTRVQTDFIRTHFPPPPASVLDIAGGSGRFAIPLVQSGYAVTVNDVNQSSLGLLEKRCSHPALQTLPGDFLKLDVPGKFDCALAIECLDRIPFREVLSRVKHLLKPGGIFVFTVMNAGSWRFLARRIAGRANTHEHVMTARQYTEAWTEAGFDVCGQRGHMWMAVTVVSNSLLVPSCASLESLLHLSSFHSQSPWLLVALRRRLSS